MILLMIKKQVCNCFSANICLKYRLFSKMTHYFEGQMISPDDKKLYL